MYKIIGENNGERTVMFIMLSFEKACDICEILEWQWVDRAGKCWDLDIVEE